jgi:hypothetical protein
MRSKIFFICLCILSGLITGPSAFAFENAPGRQIFQLTVYHLKDKNQEELIDKYLMEAYLPAVHRSGIQTVGVFKTAGIDTAADKRIYVLLTFRSLNDFHKISGLITTDKELAVKGTGYLDASYDNAPYSRKETILMEAFSGMPVLKKPEFSSPKSDRIYELRSYESATEKLYLNKVRMFNDEEMEIFERIGSQPLFYGEVLAGSSMPNLMYMTSYSDRKTRDERWKIFSSDPKWKRVSALPEYQHNTSKTNIMLLVPAPYSEL